jgi:hypothetical protein
VFVEGEGNTYHSKRCGNNTPTVPMPVASAAWLRNSTSILAVINDEKTLTVAFETLSTFFL